MADPASNDLITLTTDIVAAHVAYNKMASADLPALITTVYNALSSLGAPIAVAVPNPTPAVSVRSSIKPDYLVCLEDGRKLTMLKRYLDRKFGMTPDQYRAKWGLPADYPMVAPSYAEHRRTLAKSTGLGRRPEPTPAAAPSPRRRKPKLSLETT